MIVDKTTIDTVIALAKGIANLNDRYFDLEALSLYSGIGKSSLRHHIEVDGLPAYCPRGKILVRKSDFNSWLQQYRYRKQITRVDIGKLADEIVNEVRSRKSDKQSEGHGK